MTTSRWSLASRQARTRTGLTWAQRGALNNERLRLTCVAVTREEIPLSASRVFSSMTTGKLVVWYRRSGSKCSYAHYHKLSALWVPVGSLSA
jgi:hypothetical protein